MLNWLRTYDSLSLPERDRLLEEIKCMEKMLTDKEWMAEHYQKETFKARSSLRDANKGLRRLRRKLDKHKDKPL